MVSKKLNILLLPETAFPANRPMLVSLWNGEFSLRGHNLTWVMKPAFPLPVLRKIKWGKSQLYLLPSIPSKNILERAIHAFLNLIILVQVVKKLLIKENIDWIHAHDGFGEGLISIFSAKKYGRRSSFAYTAPFIEIKKNSALKAKGLSYYLRYTWYLFVKKSFVCIFRMSDFIFPISQNLGTRIMSDYNIEKRKVMAVNESANKLFLSKTKKNYLHSGTRKIIYVGYMRNERKLDLLLRSFKLILARFENALKKFESISIALE